MPDNGPSGNRGCPCGCGVPPRPGSKYADYDRCRKRAHRAKVKVRMEAAGLPASPSLKAATRATHAGSRPGDAQRSRQASQKRRAPDLRISYRRAVDAITELPELAELPRVRARERAQDALRPCLPPRLKDAA